MYSQFQSRYPTGSLVSELLHIYEGNYVVRAVVQVGGVTLATGMAAAPAIEQAEDQARARALMVLGIHLPTYESQAHLVTAAESQPAPARLNPASSGREVGQESRAFADPGWGLSELPASANAPTQETLGRLDFYANAYPEPEPNPVELELKPNGRGKRGKGASSRPEELAMTRSPLPEPEPSLVGPIDLSDIIAQTTIELKRLGWSDTRGRSYLQQTYGKRSRQQLTDEELLDFLHHLKAQPSPGEPSF